MCCGFLLALRVVFPALSVSHSENNELSNKGSAVAAFSRGLAFAKESPLKLGASGEETLELESFDLTLTPILEASLI